MQGIIQSPFPSGNRRKLRLDKLSIVRCFEPRASARALLANVQQVITCVLRHMEHLLEGCKDHDSRSRERGTPYHRNAGSLALARCRNLRCPSPIGRWQLEFSNAPLFHRRTLRTPPPINSISSLSYWYECYFTLPFLGLSQTTTDQACFSVF